MATHALELVKTAEEELAECEAVIAASRHTFYEVGCAVQRIRDKRLYKMRDGGIYNSFHAYCKAVWRWSRDYADRLITAVDVVENLTTIVVKDELTEGLVRPLTRLTEPSEQVECFLEAQKQAAHEGRPVTARHVAAVVRDHLGEEQSWLIKPSDNWNFSPVFYSRIPGKSGHGYIPGEVYANCLFFYTKPGDLVVDGMAGSGQIFRVYEDRARWMRPDPWDLDIHAFDLTPWGPYQHRIRKHDLRTGFPLERADYVFLDIPYYKIVHGQYSDSPHDLANMTLDAWEVSLHAIACGCAQSQTAGGLCTVISPNWRDTVTHEIVLAARLVQKAFEQHGYRLHDVAYQSRRIQQEQTANMAQLNNAAREQKIMLTDISEILTFQRLCTQES